MTAAFDRNDKPKKHYKMVNETTGEITVVEYNGVSERPTTGNSTKLYVDLDTGGGDWALANWYIWTGSMYVAYTTGPRPHKPH